MPKRIATHLLIFCALFVSGALAQEPQPSAAGEIRGTVKSGSNPLPGVSITASNTLTGKKVLTSTDISGAFVITVPSNGRYVVRAEMLAFAPSSKEVLVNAASPNAQVAFDMVLLSRVQKTAAPGGAGQEMQQLASVMAGRGSQELSVTADEGAAGLDTSFEAPEGASGLAMSNEAANESISVSGNLGQAQDFGRNIDDLRDRIGEMRSRGELPGGPGGQNGGFGGTGGGFGGPGGGGFGGRMGGGRGGFGRFNVNRPHGNLSYSMNNSALDAAPYSLSGDPTTNPDYASHRFGASVGGPLKVPKLFDAGPNTNYFINFSGSLSTNPYDVFSHVPTLEERRGDFSALPYQLYYPNGQPIVGNQITNIDPAAAGLLAFIPEPNQTGLQNYHFASSSENNSTNLSFRITHNFSARATNGGARANGGAARGGRGRRGRGSSINFGLNYSRSNGDLLRPFPTIYGTSNSRGLSANGGYTFSRGRWTNNLRVMFNSSRTQSHNIFANVQNVAGDLGITGISQDPADWGVPNVSFSHFSGLSDITPLSRRNNTFQITDMIIVSRGKHNLRFGGDYRRTATTTRNNTDPRGTFTFTGFGTAEYTAVDGQLTPVSGTGYDLADFLLGLPQRTTIQYSPNAYRFTSNGWDLYIDDDWRLRGNLTVQLGLRYEYTGPFTERHDQLVNLDVAPDFTAAAPVQPGEVGTWNGIFPASLVRPDRNNFSPRVGLAWRPFSKTVVRAGYGINYNLGQYQSIVQQLAFQPPFSFTQTNTSSLADPLTFENGFPAATGPLVTNNYGIDPDYRLGYVQMWNLNVQRDLGWGTMLNVGYTGSKGTALDMVRAPNRGPDGLRIAGVQPFLWETSQGSSILHAGSLRVRKRMQRGISVGATYTFSKSIDNASSIGGGATVVAQNDLDLAAERGLSSFDQRQRLTADFVFDLPFGEGRKWFNTSSGALANILGNWEWSGSFTAASGRPFTARVLGDFTDVSRGTNGTLRADATGQPISLANPTLAEWFNTAAFTLPGLGQFGNAGRNTIIGPGSLVFNMSFSRSFPMKDMMGFEVRADATNVFNTPQFAGIDTTVNSPTFGQVISVGSMRRVQISTRFRF